ncbi:acetylcholinesterase-like [Dermacentor andersoni]|uniref:acetylcholinesterase-like n=1 Tax=Dermacentor andersoni TaxID=34620 RepID=UPI003B3A1E8E
MTRANYRQCMPTLLSLGSGLFHTRELKSSFDPDQVITTAGKLKGGSVDAYGVRLHRWLGVPYAHFGSGSKRFASAQPAAKASSHVALDATEWSPPCAQLVKDTLFGREDCLRVNVWEPVSAAKKPLLLAMTQDWFSRGSNNVPEWEQLAAKAGAVVISPNVRLGVLGFLGRTSPVELDPDLAIRDAMVAVHWALDNAAAFHADPSRVMLVGHGSGAYVLTAAVQALKLSCMRAVLEGPVLGSVLPTNTDTINTWVKLASALGCRGDESELEPCVQDAELPDLLEAAASVTFPFMPRWDPSKWLVKAAALQVQEVIAGVDVDEMWAFFREHIKPWAVASGCAVPVVQLYDCTLKYLFTNGTSVYWNLLHAFEPKNESDIVRLLAMLMSGCDTHRIAQGAQKAGYHYVTEGSGKTLFEPLLDVEALAAFLKDG